jgi:hypothetical protein
LRLCRHALLGFDGGVQTRGPAAIESDPALELIDHLDGAVFDDVVDVAVQQGVSVKRILDGLVNRQTAIVKEIPASQGILYCANSSVGQRHIVGSRIDREVLSRTEIEHDLVGNVGEAVVARFPAGDHQRDARLVNQDGVGLIDNGGVKLAVNLLIGSHGYTVAQEVESDLVLGGIGNVGGIGGPSLSRRHPLLNMRDRETQQAVDAAHPSGVPAGEIVIDGHHVDAATLAREPRDGRRRGQRFALPGLHLGDRAARERERPPQLHVIHVLPQGAERGGRGKGDPTGKIFGFRCGGAQLGVTQTRECGSHRVDPFDGRPVAVEHRA